MTNLTRNLLLIAAAIVVASVVLTQVTYIPRAAAEDFGIGTLECAATVGPTSANMRILEGNGWKIRESRKGGHRYQRNDLGVRLILMEGQPGCLTQGFAESDDQFPAINEAVSAALKAKYGSQFRAVAPTKPNEQTYLTGDLLHLVSGKNTSDGLEVRVTSIWDRSLQ